MRELATRFWTDQSGATAVEYGIINAFLNIVICGAVAALTDQIYSILGYATNAINNG